VGLLYWKKGAGARRNINFRFPVTYFAKAPQVIKPGMTECGECGNDIFLRREFLLKKGARSTSLKLHKTRNARTKN
jgi:hypothetical protein